MIKKFMALTMIPLATGCGTMHMKMPFSGSKVPTVAQARETLEDGEFYEARRMTSSILEKYPSNKEAQKLMAEIIDKEISREKEVFETTAPEEYTNDQKKLEAKTWLERGQALLEAQEYDEAMLATEKVFQYDPGNAEASALLDDIRNQAIVQGKEAALVERRVVLNEIGERVTNYHRQAAQWIKEGKLGAAKLAIDKILLLSPEDESALRLREQLKRERAKTGVK